MRGKKKKVEKRKRGKMRGKRKRQKKGKGGK